jgi:Fe-Mn family superoxide dismutase
MPSYSRRDFIVNASTGAALAALSTDLLAAETPATTPTSPAPATDPIQKASITPAFTSVHEPKPLPFNPGKLDGISEKLISA